MSCRREEIKSSIVYVTQRRLHKRMLVTQDSLDFFKTEAACRTTSKANKEKRPVYFDDQINTVSLQETNAVCASQTEMKSPKNSKHSDIYGSKNSSVSKCKGVNVIVSVAGVGASVQVQQRGVKGCVAEKSKKNNINRKMMKRTKGSTVKPHHKEMDDLEVDEVWFLLFFFCFLKEKILTYMFCNEM